MNSSQPQCIGYLSDFTLVIWYFMKLVRFKFEKQSQKYFAVGGKKLAQCSLTETNAKGTAMQIVKALINDRLRVSKVS